MSTLTAPAAAPSILTVNEKPICLFQLGVLFTIRASYWSCKAGNDAGELGLSPDRINAQAIATFGTKDLVDPDRGRRVFQLIEKRARHELSKYSRPFPAANAHFAPWDQAADLIETLDGLRGQYDQAIDQFLADYPQLRSAWRKAHPKIPESVYPPIWELRRKFSFGWHAFKVAGATEATAVDAIDLELSRRRLQAGKIEQIKRGLQAECREFVAEYVMAFRLEVSRFCDRVIQAKGQVHGRTLQSIRRKIEHFHAMNVFDDADAAGHLRKLQAQITGITGEDLAQRPELARQLARACSLIRGDLSSADAISALAGRLKRRVVIG